jgi:alkanesulfonate monooxygenase SsuD/methylene tetrahydromethanopterin reductase-like flavin-dependent oxidoreductase (luciferase family)
VAADKLHLHRTAMQAAGFSEHAVTTAAMRSLVTRNVIVAETDDAAWEIAERLAGRAPFLDRKVDARSLREMGEAELTPEQALTPLFGGPGDPVVRNSCYVQGFMLVGSPDTVVTRMKEYESVGIPHLNVRFTVGIYDPDLGTPDVFERSFSLFLDEVVPQLGLAYFPDPAPDEVREHYRP